MLRNRLIKELYIVQVIKPVRVSYGHIPFRNVRTRDAGHINDLRM